MRPWTIDADDILLHNGIAHLVQRGFAVPSLRSGKIRSIRLSAWVADAATQRPSPATRAKRGLKRRVVMISIPIQCQVWWDGVLRLGVWLTELNNS